MINDDKNDVIIEGYSVDQWLILGWYKLSNDDIRLVRPRLIGYEQ